VKADKHEVKSDKRDVSRSEQTVSRDKEREGPWVARTARLRPPSPDPDISDVAFLAMKVLASVSATNVV